MKISFYLGEQLVSHLWLNFQLALGTHSELPTPNSKLESGSETARSLFVAADPLSQDL